MNQETKEFNLSNMNRQGELAFHRKGHRQNGRTGMRFAIALLAGAMVIGCDAQQPKVSGGVRYTFSNFWVGREFVRSVNTFDEKEDVDTKELSDRKKDVSSNKKIDAFAGASATASADSGTGADASVTMNGEVAKAEAHIGAKVEAKAEARHGVGKVDNDVNVKNDDVSTSTVKSFHRGSSGQIGEYKLKFSVSISSFGDEDVYIVSAEKDKSVAVVVHTPFSDIKVERALDKDLVVDDDDVTCEFEYEIRDKMLVEKFLDLQKTGKINQVLKGEIRGGDFNLVSQRTGKNIFKEMKRRRRLGVDK